MAEVKVTYEHEIVFEKAVNLNNLCAIVKAVLISMGITTLPKNVKVVVPGEIYFMKVS